MKAIVESGVSMAAIALGLPVAIVAPLIDLFETIAGAPDVSAAVARAKQNALADAEDAAAVEAADEIIKHGGKVLGKELY